MTVTFAPRMSVQGVDERSARALRFPMDEQMPHVPADAGGRAEPMIGWMNPKTLGLTIETREEHCFSRTGQDVWLNAATSGLTQRVVEMRIDADQDTPLLAVDVAGSGASCHVGDRSCLQRAEPLVADADRPLPFTESRRRFDPVAADGDARNPPVP